MYLPKYTALASSTHETYEFLSSGPKGTIKKVVQYSPLEPGLYNLGFGDWDEVKQEVKDNTRSNNADRDKVLATVAGTVVDFMKHHPDATLFARGETRAKTRLYQMAINSNWHEISELFVIEGNVNGNWEPFEIGKNYQAFILKAK